MVTKIKELPKLEPIKFPRTSGSATTTPKIQGTGQSTKKVIAEIKRLSKKDIYPVEQT